MAEQAAPQESELEVKTDEDKGDNKTDSTPKSIPYDRFSKVVHERNDATDRIKSLEAALEATKQEKKQELDKDLERRGEFEILAGRYKEENTDLKKKMDGVSEYEAVQRGLLTDKLPENKKAFATGMGLTELALFVDIEIENKVIPREDATPGKRFGGYDNIEEFARKDRDGYAKAKKDGSIKEWRSFGMNKAY